MRTRSRTSVLLLAGLALLGGCPGDALPPAKADVIARDSQSRDANVSDTQPGDTGSDGADAAVDATQGVQLIRLAGADRVKTAVAVSGAGWANSSNVVVVSGKDTSFPDGIVAAPLAAKRGGPVLMTSSLGGCSAGDALLQEIARLGATTIEVIGGSAAVSDACLAALGGGASRVAGANRYATAATVAGLVGAPSKAVFVVSGLDFPDGVVAGPAAGFAGMPILLSTSSALPADTQTALSQLGVTSTVVVGGPAAVSTSGLPSPQLLWGANRCETSVAVAKYAVASLGTSYQRVIIANGSKSIDGVVAAGLGAKFGAAVLLSANGSGSATTLCAGATTLLKDNRAQISTVYLIGGSASIDPSLESTLTTLLK